MRQGLDPFEVRLDEYFRGYSTDVCLGNIAGMYPVAAVFRLRHEGLSTLRRIGQKNVIFITFTDHAKR